MPFFASKALFLAAGLMLLATTAADAVSPQLKRACRDDYFAHCSAHAVGSAGLRRCMRARQAHLSDRCLHALVAAGEASKADVRRYRMRKRLRR
jgi:hypothetical protein